MLSVSKHVPKKKKIDLIQKCKSRAQNIATSHSQPHEKLLAYDTVLESQV